MTIFIKHRCTQALSTRTLWAGISFVLLSLSGCSITKTEHTTSTHEASNVADFKPYVEIYDAEAQPYLAQNAAIKTLGQGYIWTEGPVWINKDEASKKSGYLLFSDIPNNTIMKYTPNHPVELYLEKSGATQLYEGDYSQGSNGLLLSPTGKLVLLQQGDRRVALMDADLSQPQSRFKTLASHYENKRLNSPNDAVYHADGSLYFTDPPYGLAKGLNDKRKALSYQGIYRISPTGKLELLDSSVNFPNGIGLSLDQKTLFVAVSDQQHPRWLAYDVQDDGSVSNKRILIDARKPVHQGDKGMPDGMVLHSSGNLFMTGPGGVWFVTPKGKVLAKIYTGKLTANCTLSADEKTLYLTAHDTLMSVQLK